MVAKVIFATLLLCYLSQSLMYSLLFFIIYLNVKCFDKYIFRYLNLQLIVIICVQGFPLYITVCL